MLYEVPENVEHIWYQVFAEKYDDVLFQANAHDGIPSIGLATISRNVVAVDLVEYTAYLSVV